MSGAKSGGEIHGKNHPALPNCRGYRRTSRASARAALPAIECAVGRLGQKGNFRQREAATGLALIPHSFFEHRTDRSAGIDPSGPPVVARISLCDGVHK